VNQLLTLDDDDQKNTEVNKYKQPELKW